MSIVIDSETIVKSFPMSYPEKEMAESAENLSPEEEIARLWQEVKRLTEHNKALEQLVRKDSLTGLANKLSFKEELDRAIAGAKRDGRPVTVIMADLDNFRKINDQMGHLAGDAALVNVAKVMAAGVRKTDRVCRFGGEEIVIILPNTPINGAIGVAERLRSAIESSPTLFNDLEIKITASLGVSSFNPNIPPATQNIVGSLIETADKSMYAAKRAGKNCVGFTDNNGKQRVLEQSPIKPSGKVATYPAS